MGTTQPVPGPRVVAACRQLRQRIACGEFVEGEPLPPQRQLSRGLGVSLGTLSRAIACLQAEGVVESRPGAGVYVRPRDPAPRSGIVSYMYSADGESLAHVQNAALSRGYLLSVFSQCQSDWHPQAERLFLQKVKEQRHHALLAFCSPTAPTNDDLLAEIAAGGTRVLHIEHYRSEPPDQPYLLPDFARAAHMAVVRLLIAGYGPLFLFSGERPDRARAPFLKLLGQGFAQALEEHADGWQTERNWLWAPPSEEFGRVFPGYAETLPRGAGVVAMSAMAGRHLIEQMERLGRSVPEELGVIGVDVDAAVHPSDLDVMSFGRPDLIDRAMELVAAPEWAAPRELVAPVHVPGGSTLPVPLRKTER